MGHYIELKRRTYWGRVRYLLKQAPWMIRKYGFRHYRLFFQVGLLD